MGKRSPRPPPAPDPHETAAAQGAQNRETALFQRNLNLVDQYTPYGSQVYTPIGDDRFRSDITLSPDARRAVEAELGVAAGTNELALDYMDRIRDATAQPVSFEGLPAAPVANEENRRAVEEALFSRLNPQFERDRAALETQLANQGITPGSEAYNREMQLMGQGVNDARMQAVLASGQEQSRLFGLESAQRDRAIQEMFAQRNAPINEVGALLGTGQVSTPQFAPPPQTGVAPTDVTGPVYAAHNAQMQAWNQRQQSRNAMLGGLFGLGGAALGGWAYGGFG